MTAFTLGHSVMLDLATLRLASVGSAWVEFLIPVTTGRLQPGEGGGLGPG